MQFGTKMNHFIFCVAHSHGAVTELLRERKHTRFFSLQPYATGLNPWVEKTLRAEKKKETDCVDCICIAYIIY